MQKVILECHESLHSEGHVLQWTGFFTKRIPLLILFICMVAFCWIRGQEGRVISLASGAMQSRTHDAVLLQDHRVHLPCQGYRHGNCWETTHSSIPQLHLKVNPMETCFKIFICLSFFFNFATPATPSIPLFIFLFIFIYIYLFIY